MWKQANFPILGCLILSCAILGGPIDGAASEIGVQVPVRLYVATTGDDRNDGLDEAHPMASVDAAIAQAAALDRAAVPDTVSAEGPDLARVLLASGTFSLEKAIALSPDHSGRAGRPIVIEGASDGSTKLTGVQRLHFRGGLSDSSVASGVPPEAQGKVIVYELPEEALANKADADPAFPVVFLAGDEMLLSARWPQEGYARAVKSGPSGTLFDLNHDVTNWTDETGLEACGFFGPEFYDECIAVEIVNAKKGQFKLAHPAHYGLYGSFRVAIVNVRAELSRPGLWSFDRKQRKLLIWPPIGAEAQIGVARLATILEANRASHLVFKNLTFDGSRADALVLRGVEDISLERVWIRNAGARAVAGDGSGIVIRDCEIRATGLGGIYLSGGDADTLRPSGNLVQNCRISDFNRRLNGLRSGIWIEGSGTAINDNDISDSGGIGISVYSGETSVLRNRLFRILTRVGDAGAIDVNGRDWTRRNVIIEGNVIHDVRTVTRETNKGIYLDDLSSFHKVRCNMLLRVDYPLFMGGGRGNVIEYNVVVGSEPAIYMDARGQTWARNLWDGPGAPMTKRLEEVLMRGAELARAYPDLAGILNNRPGMPVDNVFAGNLFLQSSSIKIPDSIRKLQDWRTEPTDESRNYLDTLPVLLENSNPAAADFSALLNAGPADASPRRKCNFSHAGARAPAAR